MDDSTIKELLEIVGPQNAITEPAWMFPYGEDATKIWHRPDLVLFPHSALEVSKVLELANKRLFSVIPRGAGTGMSGGAVPVGGGVVLVLTRMDRILEISPQDGLCTVEPGVRTLELQTRAKELGLFYPPDPASAKDSSIGGNIAECAGGLRAIKYGVTREYVLGLEVVLPTGEVVQTGGRTLKGVVGYDLTRLMIGSEGTLGIITKAILKLIPHPQTKATLLATFQDVDMALACLLSVLNTGILPSAAEFMDTTSYLCIKEDLNYQIPYKEPVFLIFEVDGRELQVKEDMKFIEGLANQYGTVLEQCTEGEGEKIWAARRNLSPSMYKLRPNKTSQDIVIPRSKVTIVMKKIHDLSKEFHIPIPVFGHLGDGNLHVNFMYDAALPEDVERVQKAVRILLKTVLELGGSISGEHGIGIVKSDYLEMELGPGLVNVMKKIKKSLDPNNILNPGKVFPTKV
jgi:glycolate oxidase